MSRFSNIKISKGGKLFADEWIYDKEKRKGEMERNIDITNHAQFLFHQNCILDKNTTFKDILLLIKNIDMYPMLSPLLTAGPWLKEMVDEGLSDSSKPWHAVNDSGEIQTSKNGEIWSHKTSDNPSIRNIIINWAPTIQDDFYHKGGSLFDVFLNIYGEKENDPQTYALDFSPINTLINCSIILDRDFIIYDERSESLKGRREYLDSLSEEEYEKEQYHPALVKASRDFTLYDILYGLFWELSYHGGPKNRDEKSAELVEQCKKIDSGEEEMIPHEKLREKLNER